MIGYNTLILSLSAFLNTAFSIFLAITILLVMITVHEAGHYLAGKILKFKINEFAIGFGPKLYSRTSRKSGEVFSVRLLPLGGFCAFDGEDGEENKEGAFTSMSPWKRIIVLISGPLTNYLLALLLIIVSMFSCGQMLFKVGSVSPAEENYAEYSLVADDKIYEIEGKGIYLTVDLMAALNGKKQGETVKIKVIRDNVKKETQIKLRTDCDFKNSTETNKLWRALGIGTYESTDGLYWAIGVENYRFGFFETIGRSFVYSFKIAGTIFKILGELLTGKLGISAMGGPVTTIKLTSELASQGFQSFLEIAAYIGVNLAVFNLLPIPALDGSKVVFCSIEWIFKKPLPRKIENILHAVGFFLILLFAIVTDILQFI